MRKGNDDPISPELQAELAALEAMPDDQIDTSEMPEVTDWTGAKRGAFFRPIKKQLTLRLDMDLIAYFQGDDPEGYQTRINAALREYVESH
ncbi:MAG TPA: BrnA antitoxin family protein [Stellaceae bacterium]|nr:BrnA antitoxin family protein [Stellaceae bacterium]